MMSQVDYVRAIVSANKSLVPLSMIVAPDYTLVCKGTLIAFERRDGTPLPGDSVVDRIDVSAIRFRSGTHYLAYDRSNGEVWIRADTCWVATRFFPLTSEGGVIRSRDPGVNFRPVQFI